MPLSFCWPRPPGVTCRSPPSVCMCSILTVAPKSWSESRISALVFLSLSLNNSLGFTFHSNAVLSKKPRPPPSLAVTSRQPHLASNNKKQVPCPNVLWESMHSPENKAMAPGWSTATLPPRSPIVDDLTWPPGQVQAPCPGCVASDFHAGAGDEG